MSIIRRINAAARLEAKLDTAREAGNKVEMITLIAKIRDIRPRGSGNALEHHGVINTQHYGAHKKLQEAPIGRAIPIAWETKNGKTMHGTYNRQGYRANISRKWLPAEARV